MPAPRKPVKRKRWKVYIILCRDGRLYTGITSDLDRRLKEHSSGRGARFTRCFGVDRLIYSESKRSRSSSLVREAEIKKWPKARKLELAMLGAKRVKPA